MKDRVFVDTNILIYAHDLDAGHKHEIAAALIEGLWAAGTGVVSTQVLQEFYVNVTRKIMYPLPPAQARGVIEDYLVWHVVLNDAESILMASELEERYQLSFWDGMIVAAACRAKADKIVTEDLNAGQKIEGVLVENPFLSSH
jgi:predicted nucleic acid-binding protein